MAARKAWIETQPELDPRRLVFIDETWTKTNMAPLRGWNRRGHRLVEAPVSSMNTRRRGSMVFW